MLCLDWLVLEVERIWEVIWTTCLISSIAILTDKQERPLFFVLIAKLGCFGAGKRRKIVTLTANWEMQSLLLPLFVLFDPSWNCPYFKFDSQGLNIKTLVCFFCASSLAFQNLFHIWGLSKYCHYLEKKYTVQEWVGNHKGIIAQVSRKGSRMIMKWGELCLSLIRSGSESF